MRTSGPASVFALFVITFVFYTNDYIVAGVLPELAQGVHVSVAVGGQLVSVFSLTIAFVAPLAAVVLVRIPRRRLFGAALLLFICANIAAAFAPSFGVLVGLRIIAAAAAGAATPAIFAFAASLAPPGRAGRYVAIVTLAVTGSLAAGVPLGTWIGGLFGWRAVFASMALAGIVSVILVLGFLPKVKPYAGPASLAEQFRTLAQRPILLGLLASCALMCGAMMLLTYFAPYLDAITESGLGQRELAFSLAGFAGMVGVIGGGLAVDRLGATRTLTIGVAVFLGTMLALWSLRFFAPVPFPLVLAFGIVWGGTAFWNAPAIQTRLHGLAGPHAHQALAFNTSSNFLGVSLGGVIGGIIIAGGGTENLPLFSAAFGALALAFLYFASRSDARVRVLA